MDFQQVVSTLKSDDGLKQMMMQDAFENPEYGHSFSQADLIADVINILRMDTKRMAEAHGVDISISKMTPERAAELLQGVAKGNDLGLVDIFDDIEDKRMTVLAELEGEDAVEQYAAMKRSTLYSVPEDFDPEDAEPDVPETPPAVQDLDTTAAEVADEN